MKLTVYTDGGSLNNPGRAASAYLLYEGTTLLYQEGTYIGIASNNVAEYTALIHALTKIKELIDTKVISSLEHITVYADSQLMVHQLNGLYKVKHPDMKKLFDQVKVLQEEITVPITYTHVLREKNHRADALVKQALANS
jgi:ribonuclease HI